MFDMREIKRTIPTFKEYGRIAVRTNYDPASPIIVPLTSFEWKDGPYGLIPLEYFMSRLKIKKGALNYPLTFINRVLSGSDLKPWKEREVCNG